MMALVVNGIGTDATEGPEQATDPDSYKPLEPKQGEPRQPNMP